MTSCVCINLGVHKETSIHDIYSLQPSRGRQGRAHWLASQTGQMSWPGSHNWQVAELGANWATVFFVALRLHATQEM